MGLRINQNIAAFNSYRNLTVSDGNMAKSLEKLSSGFRINRAGDDAAGLVISEKLRSQIGGLKVASRNAQDGISVVQTAEGALQEVHSILQRMRDLAVQAANTGSQDTNATGAAQAEITQLTSEIDRISSQTKFGANVLLGGAFASGVGTLTFQIGSDSGNTIGVNISSVTGASLGVSSVNVSSGASAAITAIDTAIDTVSTLRGNLGALQNRFEHTIANLSVTQENLSASESRIRDTDMASEMTNLTKSQILMQAGTAMLAQANSAPQSVLQLLRG
jgi:flagellin